jgi:hypothetical protein
MTRALNQQAAYHLTRQTGPTKIPTGRDVAFYAKDGGSAHLGSFWAYAPKGLWLVNNGCFVLVGKLNKHERALHATDGVAVDYIERAAP